MIKKLKELNFSEKEFNNKKFYRLQKLEDLRMKKMINDELIWINRNQMLNTQITNITKVNHEIQETC